MSCPLTIATNASLAIGGNVYLGGSALVNNGTVAWTYGYVQGSSAGITNNGLWLAESGNQIAGGIASFVNNGIFRVMTGGGISMNSQSFVNNGTVDAEAGLLYINDGGNLSGTYNAAAGTAIYFNSGTFSLGVLPNFTGTGTFEFNGGTLNIANNPAPALQLVGGTVVLGPVFQDAGAITNLTIAGSTLAGTNTIAGAMNWMGGYISGQLTVAPGGVLNAGGWNGKYLSSSTLINSGTVIWTGGGWISGDDYSSVTNNGTWLAETDEWINFGGANAVFVNNGLFQKTYSYGTTTFNNLTFINNGTVDAESGVIRFDYGGTIAGTYYAAAGAGVHFDGGGFNLGAAPVFAGAGAIQLTGGAITFSNDIPPGLQLTGGTFSLGAGFQNGGQINNLTNNGATLSGDYTVTGTLTWLAGYLSGSLTIATNATLDIFGSYLYLPSATLTNNGAVVWSGGPVAGAGSIIVNNGLWLASANSTVGGYWGPFSFANNGTFRNTAGATYFNGVSFNNYGLADVEGGTLYLDSGGLLAGNYNVGPYADLYFSGGGFTAAAPPVVEGAGLCEFNSGTLTLLDDQIPNLVLGGGTVALGPAFQNSGAITNLTLSGSTLAGSNVVTGTLNWVAGGLNGGWLTVAANGLLNFNSGSQKYAPNSVLVNNGTVAWNGGPIHGNYGTFITNNGLWLVQTDNSIDNYNVCCGGNPTFVNAGTFAKSGTFGATTLINVSFLNSGTLDIESGAVNFASSGTYAQTGATLEFGVTAPNLAGQLNVPGQVNLDGTLTVHFLNGYTPVTGDTLNLITYTSESGQPLRT